MSLQVDSELGHYTLLERIGVGGQGIIYRAVDNNLSRAVAIKVFSAREEHRRKKLARFKYEAHLVSSLNHRNICNVYALFEDEDHTYMVMEYIEGKNLFELAFGRPLEIESTLRIALQLLDALCTAHAHGIIHRDVKPRNVMVSESGHVTLLDFGLATVLEDQDREQFLHSDAKSREVFFEDYGEDQFSTQEGAPLGTPASSPPEMALGESGDRRSDIFSVGILLYLILTGAYPFTAKTKAEVRRKIVEDDPVPIAEARKSGGSVPSDLANIVERSMRKDPDERFQSVDDMRNELKQIFESEFGSNKTLSILPGCETTLAPQPPVMVGMNKLSLFSHTGLFHFILLGISLLMVTVWLIFYR